MVVLVFPHLSMAPLQLELAAVAVASIKAVQGVLEELEGAAMLEMRGLALLRAALPEPSTLVAAAAVHLPCNQGVFTLLSAATAAPALSSFATWAHSAAQAAR
jgi:hypothetical protein